MPSVRPAPGAMREWELARLAEREQTITTVRCLWCPWTLEATVKEGREAYAAHRTTAHPEVKPKPRLKRHRLFGQVGPSNLDENIKNARTQGGATWASDA